ncbi:hypothetical protein NPIL_327041 [Nephila pilipes]|uniref:Uncharacterized protein n=1 Tax=Nephila pilipes TaxID=299642 RepID=A0A8X6PEB8_NEPPI|nr:hypothetical protein NPIL_327041 [Nephila pilipes]
MYIHSHINSNLCRFHQHSTLNFPREEYGVTREKKSVTSKKSRNKRKTESSQKLAELMSESAGAMSRKMMVAPYSVIEPRATKKKDSYPLSRGQCPGGSLLLVSQLKSSRGYLLFSSVSIHPMHLLLFDY